MSYIKYRDADGAVKYIAGRNTGNDPQDPFIPEQVILQENLATASNQITTHQYLNDIRNKDFATQSTLLQVSERINRITKVGSTITQNIVISSTANVYNFGASVDLIEFNSVGIQVQVVTASTNAVDLAMRVQFSGDNVVFNFLSKLDANDVSTLRTFNLGSLNVVGPLSGGLILLPRSMRYMKLGFAALAAPGTTTGVVQAIIQGLNN